MNHSDTPSAKAFDARNFLIVFATIMLFWVMLQADISSQSLLVGAAVSLLISLLYPNSLSFFSEFCFSFSGLKAGFQYFGYLFWQILVSNLSMAKIVLSPRLPINPAIVKGKTTLKSKMGRLLLANSITLTPGTLTVELDGEWIYLHVVNLKAAKNEQYVQEIIAGFEKYLKVMYG